MGRLIDADVLLSEMEKLSDLSARYKDEYLSGMQQRLETCIELVEDAPTVDAVPVRNGQWNCSDDMYESAVCSCCGWDTTEPWVHIKDWFQFCPRCGADMRKDGDHEKAD